MTSTASLPAGWTTVVCSGCTENLAVPDRDCFIQCSECHFVASTAPKKKREAIDVDHSRCEICNGRLGDDEVDSDVVRCPGFCNTPFHRSCVSKWVLEYASCPVCTDKWTQIAPVAATATTAASSSASSSTTATSATLGSPAKKKLKPDEVRQKPYRSCMSSQTRQRLNRAKGQRLYLLKQEEAIGLMRTYSVMGATGNVYTVKIAHKHHCSCPDFWKGHLCKHVLFVLSRVLKLSNTDPKLWQAALLSSELHGIFDAAPVIDHTAMASEQVRAEYARLTGEESVEEVEAKLRMPWSPEDECCICYEELGGDELDWCHSGCGQSIHLECIKQWLTKTKSCPLCRVEPWAGAAGPKVTKKPPRPGGGGYVNLSHVAPASSHSVYNDPTLYPSVYTGYRRRYYY